MDAPICKSKILWPTQDIWKCADFCADPITTLVYVCPWSCLVTRESINGYDDYQNRNLPTTHDTEERVGAELTIGRVNVIIVKSNPAFFGGSLKGRPYLIPWVKSMKFLFKHRYGNMHKLHWQEYEIFNLPHLTHRWQLHNIQFEKKKKHLFDFFRKNGIFWVSAKFLLW